MTGIIYKITCQVSDKTYIGKTVKNLDYRIKQHIYYSNKSQYPLHRAIKKYGIHSFKIEILQEVEEDKLNDLEKYYIKLYNTKNKGYNCTDGGDGITGYKHKQEFKQNVSKRTKGILNPNYGKHHTLEAKLKIAASNNWKGKKHKKESCEKVSIAKGGKKFAIIKDDIIIDTFISMRECARKYNLDNSRIAKCLKNSSKHKTVKQYKFKYI